MELGTRQVRTLPQTSFGAFRTGAMTSQSGLTRSKVASSQGNCIQLASTVRHCSEQMPRQFRRHSLRPKHDCSRRTANLGIGAPSFLHSRRCDGPPMEIPKMEVL